MLERAERLCVKADRAIELAQALAHPGDDVDEQGRCGACDFDQRSASEAQSGDARASACGRAARQLPKRPQLADQRRSVKRRNGNGAASAVRGDRHLPLQDQHCVIAGFALHHEDGVGVERLEFGGFDQECKVIVGQLTERARRPNGGPQLRGIFHVIMGRSPGPRWRCGPRRILARVGSCPQSGDSSCGGRIFASAPCHSRRCRNLGSAR